MLQKKLIFQKSGQTFRRYFKILYHIWSLKKKCQNVNQEHFETCCQTRKCLKLNKKKHE